MWPKIDKKCKEKARIKWDKSIFLVSQGNRLLRHKVAMCIPSTGEHTYRQTDRHEQENRGHILVFQEFSLSFLMSNIERQFVVMIQFSSIWMQMKSIGWSNDTMVFQWCLHIKFILLIEWFDWFWNTDEHPFMIYEMLFSN